MSFIDQLLYLLLRGVLTPLSLLSLGVLYLFSDFLAWLARDVVKYRRRVVEENIASALPELSAEQQARTVHDFYSWLADYGVETLKLLTISRKEMARRLIFSHDEELRDQLRQGRSVSLFLGHYGNWEWISSMPMTYGQEGRSGAGVMCGQVYHPLENKAFNKLFLHIRSRFGAHNIPMNDTLRVLLRWNRQEHLQSMVGYIADQTPNWNSIHHWVDFLHHDTPVFTGAERIARKLDTATFYLDVTRPRRGFYHVRFVEIASHAADTPPNFITDRYYQLLAQSIHRSPAMWLWSHRRWKRTRQQWHALGHTDAELQ